MLSARLGSHTPPRQLDRSNDGQDHTVLPYARPAMSPQFSRPCRRSRKLADETKPSSAARPHAAASSQGLPALPAPLMPTLPRPPQARLANKTTTRSPLKDEPGWATHTTFPNFGKVEYFCGEGLTGWRNRVVMTSSFFHLLRIPTVVRRETRGFLRRIWESALTTPPLADASFWERSAERLVPLTLLVLWGGQLETSRTAIAG
jgi:hypothetical protein